MRRHPRIRAKGVGLVFGQRRSGARINRDGRVAEHGHASCARDSPSQPHEPTYGAEAHLRLRVQNRLKFFYKVLINLKIHLGSQRSGSFQSKLLSIP